VLPGAVNCRKDFQIHGFLMRQRVSLILTFVLLACFGLNAGSGFLLVGVQTQVSCCGAAACACCDGGMVGDESGCEAGDSAPTSGRYAYLWRPSACDPETGLPQPVVNWHHLLPSPRTALYHISPISEAVLLSTPSHEDPFKPSIFRPPRP